MTSAAIVLPGGLWRDGVRHQEAVLRPLAGADELFLVEDGASLLPAQRVTVLLARCLERLGPWHPVTPQMVRELTVGDREALLLHLRRATLGERIECVLRCPRPDCQERMDLDLAVGDLLVPPYADSDSAPAYETDVVEAEREGARRRLRFRLPTGGDQEEAALLAHADVTAAAGRLLQRCIETVEAPAAGDTGGAHLPGGDTGGERLPGDDTRGAHLPGGNAGGVHLPAGDTGGVHLSGNDTGGDHLSGGDTGGHLPAGWAERLGEQTAERLGERTAERLGARTAERLGARMAELDPQAELVLHLACPACGQDFAAPFDTAAFFFDELAGRAAALYREVHRLALSYHWSEAEILALDGRRRRLYLELLAEPAAEPAR